MTRLTILFGKQTKRKSDEKDTNAFVKPKALSQEAAFVPRELVHRILCYSLSSLRGRLPLSADFVDLPADHFLEPHPGYCVAFTPSLIRYSDFKVSPVHSRSKRICHFMQQSFCVPAVSRCRAASPIQCGSLAARYYWLHPRLQIL